MSAVGGVVAMEDGAGYARALLARVFRPAAEEASDPVDLPLRVLRDTPLDREVDLMDVLRRVVDEVIARFDADRGTLYLVDHARDELVSRVAFLPEISEIRLRVGEGVAGWVARTGEAVSLPDSRHDGRFTPRIDQETGYRTESMLVAPIRERGPAGPGAVVGVLQLLNKRAAPPPAPGSPASRFAPEELGRLVRLADEVGHLLLGTSLRSQLHPGHARALDFRFNHIVGESPVMREAFRRTAAAARTHATVLVRGESGTGKEAIARAVHVNSPRRDGPFVKVDCAALPATLIENELFGHERGAFTGAERATTGKVAAAEGGTLFLDEVGELPLEVQGKILRLLQERTFLRVGGATPIEVDVRFVCATHRDLESDVAARRFRQDLYDRLRVVEIPVPPLRERGAADLDRLIDHFFFEQTRRHGRPELAMTRAARNALHAHDWPGNVRELEHCVEAAVVLAPGPVVDVEALPLGPVGTPAPLRGGPEAAEVFVSGVRPWAEVERAYLEHVLRACGGNRSEAARRLGMGRNTLIRKLGPG